MHIVEMPDGSQGTFGRMLPSAELIGMIVLQQRMPADLQRAASRLNHHTRFIAAPLTLAVAG